MDKGLYELLIEQLTTLFEGYKALVYNLKSFQKMYSKAKKKEITYEEAKIIIFDDVQYAFLKMIWNELFTLYTYGKGDEELLPYISVKQFPFKERDDIKKLNKIVNLRSEVSKISKIQKEFNYVSSIASSEITRRLRERDSNSDIKVDLYKIKEILDINGN